MPTEITTEMRQALSRVAEKSKVQQPTAVIEADKVVARQDLSETEQTMPPTTESGQASGLELNQATDEMNNYVQSLKRDLHFSVDADSGETIIRVVDSESQKLIRTIPSEEFLNMSQQLNQNIGMLVNAKA